MLSGLTGAKIFSKEKNKQRKQMFLAFAIQCNPTIRIKFTLTSFSSMLECLDARANLPSDV